MTHSHITFSATIAPDALAASHRLIPADGIQIQLAPKTTAYLTPGDARALWGQLGALLAPGGSDGPLRTLAVVLRALEFDGHLDMAADIDRALADLGIIVPDIVPALEKDAFEAEEVVRAAAAVGLATPRNIPAAGSEVKSC